MIVFLYIIMVHEQIFTISHLHTMCYISAILTVTQESSGRSQRTIMDASHALRRANHHAANDDKGPAAH